MSKERGLIFDIQGFSVHDGPGSRTLVFLSGCPLKCDWCSNPEGQELRERIMFSAQKCKHFKTGCVRCLNVCPHGAITFTDDDKKPLVLDYAKCRDCLERPCLKACYHEALRASGKWMTVSELMKVIKRDSTFWGRDGGVTFSGGECFSQPEFLYSVLQECKQSAIHTAVETTAFVATDKFLKIMRLIDFAHIDIKHMDDNKHKEKTKVSNKLIQENIKALQKSKWPGRLVLRMPIIRGYNDSPENILETAKFMNDNGLFEINILPFHRLGDSKYDQLGMSYDYSDEEPTSAGIMDEIQDIFLDQEIACYVGYATPF